MKVDYDAIAPRYDRHRGGGGPYLRRLIRLARASKARRVLELGPGTGNNTGVFHDSYPCCLIGLEPSAGMIAAARQKQAPGTWVRGSAVAMPLASRSVDFVFAVYVLHHIEDIRRVFTECARVLRRGHAAFVTASTEFIRRHPMNHYFPSFSAIDCARFQPIDDVCAHLQAAGFRHLGVERFQAEPRPINRAFADRVASKFISTYELIPPDEFEAGLKRLYADLEGRERLDELLEWESVIVWGAR